MVSGPAKPDRRAERLAKALRDNLARRKAQARDRAKAARAAPDKAGSPADPSAEKPQGPEDRGPA
jgi:hypothetical protein